MIDPKENKKETDNIDFPWNVKKEEDEIVSDGSANAFEETETVNEDNFDDLKEK